MASFTNNIEELIEKLEKFKDAILNGGPPSVGGPPVAGGDSSPANIPDALFSALNAGRALMNRRIFNAGHNEDAEGLSLGNYHGNKTRLTKKKYSIALDDEFDEKDRKKKKRVINRLVKNDANATYTEYEKYRVSRGRQIDQKDLEVDGSLRRSIETVVERVVNEPNRVVIAIGNEEMANIARYQEQQIGNLRAGVNANKGNAAPAKIFTLSESEFEHVKVEGHRLITEALNNMWNSL